MKDGWHTIAGNEVYIEDGYIIRATKGIGAAKTAACIYRALKSGYGKETKITPAAFRAGVKRGTITIM